MLGDFGDSMPLGAGPRRGSIQGEPDASLGRGVRTRQIGRWPSLCFLEQTLPFKRGQALVAGLFSGRIEWRGLLLAPGRGLGHFNHLLS